MAFTLEDLYRAVGFSPNPNQKRAIEHDDGPLFLVAGPGSGKTRVLLWRTVRLIVFEGVKPEHIFLGTFTEKAAQQLKDGLLSLLGVVTNETGVPYDISNMYVGTLHSLCQRLLTDRKISPGRRRGEAPQVIDELDQYFLLYSRRFWRSADEALNLGDLTEFFASLSSFFGTGQKTSRHQAVVNLTGIFNRFSEENLTPEQIQANTDEPWLRTLGALYAHYLTFLGKQVDLSLLQQAAYHLINQPGAHIPFRHVIVDEYQDTNRIQELLIFGLASPSGNVCVVGDDDQALYRFRGATVENFVQFPERCQHYLGRTPERIELATNYRSKREIVTLYTKYMEGLNWQRPGGGYYRLHDKGITPHSQDDLPAVVASSQKPPLEVSDEIADLIVRLLSESKVSDPNQIACLFPSLKTNPVKNLKAALELRGLKVYAPRAKRFLESDEASLVLGVFATVLGRPARNPDFDGGDYKPYHDWLDSIEGDAKDLLRKDASLKLFVADRSEEIRRVVSDYNALKTVLDKSGWQADDLYDPVTHKRALLGASGLSQAARRTLGMRHLDLLTERQREAGDPFSLRYVIGRATALDWNLLDLFYRLMGFSVFKDMFDLAENGDDEGPVANLSLVSQLLSRFSEQYPSIITAQRLQNDWFRNVFFSSYLFALWRRGDGETEDDEDPFPKGRIPFLTIHQSKGLEFPVVILGSPFKTDRGAQRTEILVRPYVGGDPEPLDRVGRFDIMRMFYVALSRAQNLLVIANPRGPGVRTDPVMSEFLNTSVRRIAQLDLEDVPVASEVDEDVSRTYSYTGDYLAYQRCARQYMIFNRFDFAASRTQTMFFGSLVHQTIEDLHNHLISLRSTA